MPDIAIVLKGYPRLSETFIAQEIAALEERGLDLMLVSLRHPTDPHRHPVHDRIRAPVRYLPEYLYQEPLRVLRGWWRARRLPGYAAARRLWLADLRRDRTANRIRRWGQALVLAAELPGEIRHLHVHFLHTPASVARYAAVLRGLHWSVSAHAKDIWTTPDWEVAEKLADAAWAVTCTAAGAAHLAGIAGAGRVDCVHHGLDLQGFGRNPAPPSARDGSSPATAVRILSVGRLVEKKGFDDLLAALALLPPALHWRLVHIGGGPLKEAMQRQAAALGLAARIEWRGAQPQAEVLGAYRAADLFVLASRIAADGDRDGLPNVLVEALSQRLAAIATAVSAIPELIGDGATGLLVPPQDPPALAAALGRAAADPDLRARLGAAGEARVRRAFDHRDGADRIAGRLAALAGLEAPARHALKAGT